MTDPPAGLRARLQAYLAHAWPNRAGLAVGPLTAITTGWESDIFAFDLAYREAGTPRREALVLRLHYGAGAVYKTGHEFHALRLLAAAHYPVPHVPLAETDPAPLGRPFLLLERIDGPVMWALLDRAESPAAAGLIDTFARLFVQLHRLDWRPFVAVAAPGRAAGTADPEPYEIPDALLAEARAHTAPYAHLGFAPVVDWLAAGRDAVPCPAPAVVHRDFHPANILLRGGHAPVVIDWTNLAISDPRVDLAWSLLLAEMFAGAAVRDAILAAYARHAGQPVAHLAWFEVHACARRLLDVAVSLTAGAEARGMRPAAADAMRQQMSALPPAYARLARHTGLRLPSIEALLAAP
jgi:aminoglycoside phosphotransferase (APT) family kinase protein